ncbi:MAG: hypothetical protein M1835_007772 [Candelina submexicana]|nr:MAG: hypothetical protein M1835_007772 [Candelina submexicana]
MLNRTLYFILCIGLAILSDHLYTKACTRSSGPVHKPIRIPSPASRTYESFIEPVSVDQLLSKLKTFIFTTQFREYPILISDIYHNQSAGETVHWRPAPIEPLPVFGENDKYWQALVSCLRIQLVGERMGDGMRDPLGIRELMKLPTPKPIRDLRLACDQLELRYVDIRERITEHADVHPRRQKSNLRFWAENSMWDELAERITIDYSILTAFSQAPPPLSDGAQVGYQFLDVIRTHYFDFIHPHNFKHYYLSNEALRLSAIKVGRYDLSEILEGNPKKLEREKIELLASLPIDDTHNLWKILADDLIKDHEEDTKAA